MRTSKISEQTYQRVAPVVFVKYIEDVAHRAPSSGPEELSPHRVFTDFPEHHHHLLAIKAMTQVLFFVRIAGCADQGQRTAWTYSREVH